MQKLPVAPTAMGPGDRFTGAVYVTSLYVGQEPSRMVVANVRFTPGARTNWHRHALGQTLHGTDGVGLVVARDGTVITIRPGDTVWTPPGQEHWHGAGADTMMCHLAMLEGTGEGDPTTWLEPVDDAEYERANRAAREQS